MSSKFNHLRPFEDNEVYEYDGHRYCEHDYKMLFANQCARCDGFVLGRGISALGREWHVECFTCQEQLKIQLTPTLAESENCNDATLRTQN